MHIQTGQIWEVTKEGFFTSGENNCFKRPIGLAVGEKIEIRYPYEWHFRTEDNNYFHAKPEMILEHCKFIGDILPEVKFANMANLEEILRLRLYRKQA